MKKTTILWICIIAFPLLIVACALLYRTFLANGTIAYPANPAVETMPSPVNRTALEIVLVADGFHPTPTIIAPATTVTSGQPDQWGNVYCVR